MAIDLSALWVLVEIGGLTGRVTFQPKFKHIWGGVAIITVGAVGSFVFMVGTMVAAFLIINHIFR
jgi:hypothetical protein